MLRVRFPTGLPAFGVLVVAAWIAAAAVPSEARGENVPPPVRPAVECGLTGAPPRYLVVTREELVPEFERLAEWKTRRGVPALVTTLEWIESRTRQGIDPAETLRNFLVDAHASWGLEWLLLGGDSSVIPTRYARLELYAGTPDEFVPTDLYFAGLDGTWNADGDAWWGEVAAPPGIDEADLRAELRVGRAPVRTLDEAQVFVDKVIAYETPALADYQDRALFLHEVLVPTNWSPGQQFFLDGAATAEEMISASLPPSVGATRLYDNYAAYPGASRLSRNATLAALAAKPGIVNHLGHGYRYNMSAGDGSIVNSDVDVLANGNRTFVLFLVNCTASAFDFDCLARHYLLNANGGAVGVVGATRAVPAYSVPLYNRALFHQLFEEGHVQLAEMLEAARLEYVALAETNPLHRQVQFALTALGDPEMTIFTDAVRVAQVTHPAALQTSATTMTVNVEANGTDVAGATVCAWKGSEVYAVSTTDGTGTAAFAVAPETPGELLLTVSGRNLATYATAIPVTTSQPPFIRVAQMRIDDDAYGASAGNGDGRADAGETIELYLDVENTGGSQAIGVTGSVQSRDAEAEVLAGTLGFPLLAPGTTAAATVLVSLAPEAADGARVDLEIVFSAAGASWTQIRTLVLCAPRLQVTRVSLAPTHPPRRPPREWLPASGSRPSYSAALGVEVKNFGSGEQPPMTATLASLGSIAVIHDHAELPSLPAMASREVQPSFELDLRGDLGEGVELQLVDAHGRSIVHHADLRAPARPATPADDPTFAAGVVRLVWVPSAEPDLLGYHVFRSWRDAPFERITDDVVLHADYRDSGTDPSTPYRYYVVAVDSSLHWSAASETTLVSTSAATLNGWPVQISAPTASSVAVGDVDGDGDLEVLVGADRLFAWHADGREVLDGDGNPNTTGVFSDLPSTTNASVALADLDGAPGQEIVAASWFTNRIYVFAGNGSVLPGWPQEPQNGGNGGYWGSPALGDVDGDGALEVVAVSKDGFLYAWNGDGSPLGGSTDGKLLQVGAWTQATPALADLDTDGTDEIIVSTSTGSLHVVRGDGSPLPGWPLALGGTSRCSPVVGDVNGDQVPEIIVTSENDRVHAFRVDGAPLSGWPVSAPMNSPDFGPSPALGDLDGDGKAEVVVVAVASPFSQSRLLVLDGDGSPELEMPLTNFSQSSPVLADLDGDGGIDIVQGGEDGILRAWDMTGAFVQGFPLALGDFIRGTPCYTDIDADGSGDLVLAGWNRDVYVWRMAGAYDPGRAPWPTFHGDQQRTGFLEPQAGTGATRATGARLLLAKWSPNPFNPLTTLAFTLPETSSLVPVQVQLFDVRGRVVRTLYEAPTAPGTHLLVWDARDQMGRRVASGMYFYRVRAGGETVSGKVSFSK